MTFGKQPRRLTEEEAAELRLENDILKLKMQAEQGAYISTGNDIPPDVEHEFLQQIMAFEEAFRTAKRCTVYELIGQPEWKRIEELHPDELEPAIRKWIHLLKMNQICLQARNEVDPATMYRFLTEEFFQVETDDIRLPGFVHNFLYEDFYPDHKSDMEDTAMDFFYHWFNRSLETNGGVLCPAFILPDGRTFSAEELNLKLKTVFESYVCFSNYDYAIGKTSFQWDGNTSRGLGHVEGRVQYEAVTESGETLSFDGPFTLYLSNEDQYWTVYNFILPGCAF